MDANRSTLVSTNVALRFGLLLGFALALAAPALAAPNSSKPLAESLSPEARKAYDAGIALYKEKDFRGAALKFEESYEASRDPRLLWNMAAAERGRHRHARTLELLDRYVEEGGDLVTDDDKARVEALRRELGSLVCRVSVSSEPAGATLFVDGVKVGSTPLAKPILLDVGVHMLRLELEGYVLVEKPEELATGDRDLQYVLEPTSKLGSVVIVAPDAASVAIDGTPRGRGRVQTELPPGRHLVRVTQNRKIPREASVVVATGKTETLSVTLEDEPPLVPIWAWVVGSGVLAAGTAVGAYFLFRPQDAEPTPSTLGEFNFNASFPLR